MHGKLWLPWRGGFEGSPSLGVAFLAVVTVVPFGIVLWFRWDGGYLVSARRIVFVECMMGLRVVWNKGSVFLPDERRGYFHIHRSHWALLRLLHRGIRLHDHSIVVEAG